MLRLALKNFIHLCHTNRLFSVISGLCLICAFTGFLFLQEKGYYKYLEYAKFYSETQLLYFSSAGKDEVLNLYTQLEADPALPSLAVATVSDGRVCGVYWDGESDQNVWYASYGRFFSAKEMLEGAIVALVGMGYIRQLAPEKIDNIWETGMEILGAQMKAVGNYFGVVSNYFGNDESPVSEELYEAEFIPDSITLPIKTFFDIGLTATRLRVVFSQPLTGEQIAYLGGLVETYSQVQSYTLPQPSNTQAAKNYADEVIKYIIVFVISFLSIVSVLLYWLKIEFTRYKIYMICGAKREAIVYLLSMNVALLITLTYACSCVITYVLTKITPPGMVQLLPLESYGVIYVGALIFALLAVNLRSLPIVLKSRILLK